ncbi:hypothetical protein ACJX0J_039235 [Zea mays]
MLMGQGGANERHENPGVRGLSSVDTLSLALLKQYNLILNVRTNRFVFKVVFTSPSLLLMNWRVALVQKKQELGKFLLDVDYSCSDSVIRINMNLCMILVISNLVLGFEILIEYFFAFKLVVGFIELWFHKCWYMLLCFKALGLGAHYQKC